MQVQSPFMKFICIFFLFPLKLFSQDITGIWTGSLYNDTTKQSLRYELAISNNDNKLSGYSHTIFVIDSIENTGVKSIDIKNENGKILISDEKLIYNNYPEPPAKGVKMFSSLSLSGNDSMMTLTGSWKTNRTRLYKSITGKIYLHKKVEYKNTLIYHKLDSLQLLSSLSFIPKKNYGHATAWVTYSKRSNPEKTLQPAAALASRKIETIQTVNIKSDSLLLTFYDDGEVDGDTVSVLLNGKVIIPMLRLTAKGISKTIYLTPEMGDSLVLIMYAENLGSIPPNTGLLVVHDGEKVYEIRFTGDLQRNSAIVLKRKHK